MVGQLWSSQGSPEVNDHEFKTQPISMVMSFHPNSSPMWVQVKEQQGAALPRVDFCQNRTE